MQVYGFMCSREALVRPLRLRRGFIAGGGFLFALSYLAKQAGQTMELTPDQIDQLLSIGSIGLDILAVIGGSSLGAAILPMPTNRNRVILLAIRRIIDVLGANVFNARNAKGPN